MYIVNIIDINVKCKCNCTGSSAMCSLLHVKKIFILIWLKICYQRKRYIYSEENCKKNSPVNTWMFWDFYYPIFNTKNSKRKTIRFWLKGSKNLQICFSIYLLKINFFFQSRCKKIIQCIPINSFTQRQRVRTLSLIESFNSWTNTPNTWPRTQTLILYCKLRILSPQIYITFVNLVLIILYLYLYWV